MSLSVPSIEQAIGREHERRRVRQELQRLLGQIDIDEQCRRRAVQQAILEAEAWFWEWRAEQFHQARPRKGDHHGQATTDELREAWNRCNALAQACLNKAAFLRWDGGGGDLDVIQL